MSAAVVAIVVAAVPAGILLLGLYGDIVVGWIVFGVATVLESSANLTVRGARKLRRSRPAEGTRAASLGGPLPSGRGR
jgi:hypothetical protein